MFVPIFLGSGNLGPRPGRVIAVSVCAALAIMHFVIWMADHSLGEYGCQCTYVQWWGQTFAFVGDILRSLW
jgi:hypothetical protein